MMEESELRDVRFLRIKFTYIAASGITLKIMYIIMVRLDLHGVMILQVLLVKKLHTIKTSVACVYACVASMSCKMQFCDI